MAEDTKVRIEFDLDQFDAEDFNVGWWEDLQNGRITPIREMIEAFAVVEGLPPGMTLTNYLRSLKLPEMVDIGTGLFELINEKKNPVKNGKNSNGGSPNTSSRKRVSRR